MQKIDGVDFCRGYFQYCVGLQVDKFVNYWCCFQRDVKVVYGYFFIVWKGVGWVDEVNSMIEVFNFIYDFFVVFFVFFWNFKINLCQYFIEVWMFRDWYLFEL